MLQYLRYPRNMSSHLKKTVKALLEERFKKHRFDDPDNQMPVTNFWPVDQAIQFHIERHDVTHILMEADNRPLGEAYVGGAEAASLGIPRLAAIIGFDILCRLAPTFRVIRRREMLRSMLKGYDAQFQKAMPIVTGQAQVYDLEKVLDMTLEEAQAYTRIKPMEKRNSLRTKALSLQGRSKSKPTKISGNANAR
jgi:hypothetical protein